MRRIKFITIVFLGIITFTTALAAVPRLINYQGRLTDTSGNPLTGTYSVSFTIYTTATGGSPIWAETHSSLVVSSGLFNVLLGSKTSFMINFDTDYYLGIKIGADPEMIPRLQMASAPYALNADKVDGKDESDFAATSHSHTATDIGTNIVSSVDGVTNDGGNINFVAGSANITIVPNDAANTITFDVPAGGSGDITAVNTSGGLQGGVAAGDANISIATGGVTSAHIGTNQVTNSDIAANAVTASKISPNIVSSIDGVTNDGGNVNFIAGSSNITIVPNDAANTITFDVPAGGSGDITAVNTSGGLQGGVAAGDANISIATGGVTSAHIGTSQVGNSDLATNAVTSSKIAAGAVGNSDLAPNAVTASKISPNIVSSVDGVVADGSNIDFIGTGNITITPNDSLNRITFNVPAGGSGDITAVNTSGGLTGGVSSGDANISIATGGVTSAHIGTGQVMTSDIGTGQVQNSDLGSNSVTSSKIASGAVGNSDLGSNAVTVDKISPNIVSSVDGVNADGSNIDFVGTGNITITPSDSLNRITFNVPAGGSGDITAVNTSGGLTGGVSSGDANISIATGGVTSAHIGTSQVGNSDLASNSVSSGKIINGSVTTSDISWPMNLTRSDINPNIDINQSGGTGDAIVGRNSTRGVTGVLGGFTTAVYGSSTGAANRYGGYFENTVAGGIALRVQVGDVLVTERVTANNFVAFEYWANTGTPGGSNNYWTYDIYDDDLVFADSIKTKHIIDKVTGKSIEVFDPASFPEGVTDANGELVNVLRMDGFLLSCIRKAHGKIKAQEAKISAQQKQLIALARRLDALEKAGRP